MFDKIKKFFGFDKEAPYSGHPNDPWYDNPTKTEDGEPEYDTPAVLRKKGVPASQRPSVRSVKVLPSTPPPPSYLGPVARQRPGPRYADDSSFINGMIVGELLSGSSLPVVPPERADNPAPDFVAGGGASGGGGASSSYESPSTDSSPSLSTDPDFSNVDSGSSSSLDN